MFKPGRVHAQIEAKPRSVYLVLCTFVFALSPQLAQDFNWVGLLCLILTLWRAQLTYGAAKIPGSLLVSLIGVLSCVGVVIAFGDSNSSTRTLLCLSLLVACRNLQARSVHQWSSTLALLPLFPMGYFLDKNPDWYVFYSVSFLLLWFAGNVDLWSRGVNLYFLKRAVQLTALSIPLVVICFYFAPRPGSFWKQQTMNRVGMSKSVSPGSVGKLAQSEGLAFTAKLEKPLSDDQLYWRGVVLRAYDGVSWTENNASITTASVQEDGSQVGYSVYVTDDTDAFRYLLETSGGVEALPGFAAKYTQLSTGVLVQQSAGFSAYKAHYGSQNKLSHLPSREDYQVKSFHPRTTLLVKSLAKGTASPGAFIHNVQSWIVSNSFVYSMEPGTMAGNWMDTFLFERRKGFCEHYASSLAYMLRSAGYASRVIAGYQGGEYQDKLGMHVIPQAAAHAWVEYWDPLKQRWSRLDPTTWVAPERLASQGWKETERAIVKHSRDASAWGKLQYLGSVTYDGWNRWVSNYDAEEQHGLLKTLGLRHIFSVALLSFVGILVILGRRYQVYQSYSRDPVRAHARFTSCYHRLEPAAQAGATVLVKVSHLQSRYPRLREVLAAWYADYSTQAYGDARGAHLGMSTTRLILRLWYAHAIARCRHWSRKRGVV